VVGGLPGQLDGTEVITGDGSRLRLITVQPEGKRAMAAADWLNGVRPADSERLGG
jgi:methionyl-tRNA formyltransferase